MNRFASATKESGRPSFLLCCIYKTTYFLGRAVRRTVDVVAVPYQTISSRFHRDGRPLLSPAPQMNVTSRRSRMTSRSQLVEQQLIDAERGSRPTGKARERHVPAPIAGAVADPDAELRCSTLRAIATSPDEDSSLLILEALHDRESGVRRAAASAAAEAGAFTAVFSLILLLDDPVLEVRKEAKTAIAHITRSKIDFDLSADAQSRKKKIEKLKNWWKEERFSRLAAEVRTGLKS